MNCNFLSAKINPSFALETIINRFPNIYESAFQGLPIKVEDYQNFCSRKISYISKAISGGDIINNIVVYYKNKYKLKIISDFFFNVPFIYAEYYFYYLLLNLCHENRVSLNLLFKSIKQNLDQAEILKSISEMKYNTLSNAIVRSLWSNQRDLSQLETVNNVDNTKIIINNSALFISHIKKNKYNKISIVLDNAGIELLNDIFLAFSLLQSCNDLIIYLHFKKYPLFVSDATIDDKNYLLHFIEKQQTTFTADFIKLYKKYVNEKRIIIKDEIEWCYPKYYNEMNDFFSTINSDLYIFKGDLNYRKVVEDRCYSHQKNITEVITFTDKPILLLRTLKSELILSIDEKIEAKLERMDKKWKINGKWGLIHYLS